MQPIIGLDPLALTAATSVPAFRLGSAGLYDDPVQGTKAYVYGSSVGVQTAGQACVEGVAGAWSPVTTALSAPGQVGGHGTRVGVAQFAASAGQFGWYQVFGTCSLLTAGAVAIGTRLNTTATAGALDDDGTAGARPIIGAVFKTAAAGAAVSADARLVYPSIGLTI
jgi:hypothetical protein